MKDLDFLEDEFIEITSFMRGVNLAVQQVLNKNFENSLDVDDIFSLCTLLDVLNEKIEKLNQELFTFGETITLKEVA